MMIAIGRDTYDISQNLFDLTEASVVLLDLTSLDRDCHTCCIVSKVRGLIRKIRRNAYFVTEIKIYLEECSSRNSNVAVKPGQPQFETRRPMAQGHSAACTSALVL